MTATAIIMIVTTAFIAILRLDSIQIVFMKRNPSLSLSTIIPFTFGTVIKYHRGHPQAVAEPYSVTTLRGVRLMPIMVPLIATHMIRLNREI